MKTKCLLVVAAIMLLSGNAGIAADTNATDTTTSELQSLVAKVKVEIQAGKKAEADFADDLKQFDALLEKHKGEKTDAVAMVLFMKARLYAEVLHNDAKASELMNQLKTEFKGTSLVADIERHELIQAEMKKNQVSLPPGTTFPDFDEKDLAGQPLSAARFKGKVVLVDFWATWCLPCRVELPNVIAAYNKYHDRGFEIIGISLDQDKAKLTSFTKAMNMPWPQFFDGQGWQNKLAVKYGIESIPATYLLDGNGNIIGKDLRGDELMQAVAKALGK